VNTTRKPITERLATKLRRGDDGCLHFTGAVMPNGYGYIGRGGKYGGSTYAHRVAWEAVHGPIPKGMEIDHLCRNRACCNPAHLELVTHRENVARGAAPSAVAHRAGTCTIGHPMSGENLYVSPGGQRHCRTCRAAYRKTRSTA